MMATGFATYIGLAADTVYHLAAPSQGNHSYDIYLPVAVALGTISCVGSIVLSARRSKVERAKESQLAQLEADQIAEHREEAH